MPHLQERLNQLFDRVPPPGAASAVDRYTTNRAAREMTERGTPITSVYLGKLRNGGQSNPSFRHLAAIAELFGVPTDYFSSDTVAAEVLNELDSLEAARHVRARGVMARSHDPHAVQFGLAQIEAIIAQIKQSQGDSDEISAPE